MPRRNKGSNAGLNYWPPKVIFLLGAKGVGKRQGCERALGSGEDCYFGNALWMTPASYYWLLLRVRTVPGEIISQIAAK